MIGMIPKKSVRLYAFGRWALTNTRRAREPESLKRPLHCVTGSYRRQLFQVMLRRELSKYSQKELRSYLKKCCLSDKKVSKKDMVSTLRDFFPQVNKEKSRSLAYFTARGREFVMKSKRNSLASSGRGMPEPSSRSFWN